MGSFEFDQGLAHSLVGRGEKLTLVDGDVESGENGGARRSLNCLRAKRTDSVFVFCCMERMIRLTFRIDSGEGFEELRSTDDTRHNSLIVTKETETS